MFRGVGAPGDDVSIVGHDDGEVQWVTSPTGRIETLSSKEQAELLSWLLERDHQSWDEQIARDQTSGKLDSLITEAKADRAAGKALEL